MPDYQLSKVYQIVCLTTGDKYIGSTTQKTLAVRLASHKSKFNYWKKGTHHFVTSFVILERGNYQIELLETCPCNSKDELNAREGHYIRTIDCVNRCIAGRTKPEYYEDNKIEHSKRMKEWYEVNKNIVLERVKVYNKDHKIEKAEYDKAYNEANKVKKAEQMKAYYLKKKAEKSQ